MQKSLIHPSSACSVTPHRLVQVCNLLPFSSGCPFHQPAPQNQLSPLISLLTPGRRMPADASWITSIPPRPNPKTLKKPAEVHVTGPHQPAFTFICLPPSSALPTHQPLSQTQPAPPGRHPTSTPSRSAATVPPPCTCCFKAASCVAFWRAICSTYGKWQEICKQGHAVLNFDTMRMNAGTVKIVASWYDEVICMPWIKSIKAGLQMDIFASNMRV